MVAPTIKLVNGYFHGPSMGIVTGFLYMSHQLGSAIDSYFPGVLFDQAGNYTSSFVIAAFSLVIASFLSFSLPKKLEQCKVSAA